jgi:transposase
MFCHDTAYNPIHADNALDGRAAGRKIALTFLPEANMPKDKPTDPKLSALARSGTLHPHPERVTDELFDNPFFDPRDRLQVKYEMLRRVRVDGQQVSRAARSCGLSRPTYYQALAAFERDGLAGLLPAKKGPKRAHKLTPEVLAFVEAELEAQPKLKAAELARRVKERFDLRVHPKSFARARREKGGARRRRGGTS